MDKPIFSIITVGMNHFQFIRNLYESLYNEVQPPITFEAIYVDNCSSDGSVSFIRENYPQVIILENDKIRGFGENNNIGASYAKGQYIGIINPDIVILKGCISNIYQYIQEYDQSKIGIIVPQLLNPDYSIQYSVRKFITLKLFIYRLMSRGKDSSENEQVENYLQKNINTSETQTVDWAIGAAMFIERSFFTQLGGFDQDYFLYMEDEDLCVRSWKKGRSVVYLPKAQMIHNHQRSSSKLGRKTMLHLKSLTKFFRKHGVNFSRSQISLD